MLYNSQINMRSPEFELIDPVTKPNLETIRELQQKRFVKDGSPLWWSTDYAPDAREYVPFDEFRERLVYLGECSTTRRSPFFLSNDLMPREVYLYPEPKVPISLLNLEVEGYNLPFLVTARPYHKNELSSSPFSKFLAEHPLESLPSYVQNGGVVDLPNHFYPHIRGLFAGTRGSHYFWYLTHATTFWEEFGKPIRNALEKKNLGFIGFYDSPMSGDRSYTEVWDELAGKPQLVDQKRPTWVDFPRSEVSAEEFIQDYQKTDQDLIVYYPLRLPDFESTLPLVIATKTHKTSNLRSPAVLDIYAENGYSGYCRRGGILRIKDRRLAENVSKVTSEDFGFPVDTVLFTPQKGRPKYERVSSK